MVYNPLDLVIGNRPEVDSQDDERSYFEQRELQKSAASTEGTFARHVISVEDLLDDDRLGFWTSDATVSAIERTEQRLREELSEEDEFRRIKQTKEGVTIESQIDIDKALQAGSRSSYYNDVANVLYGKALKVANVVTSFRGTEREMIAARVVDEFLGLGPIEPLTRDPVITEIMVNAHDKIFFEKGGRIEQAKAANFRSPEHTVNVATRFLRAINKSVSNTTPLVDGQLSDGSRVNVIHDSISDGETVITIRRFPNKTWTLMDLVDMGSLPMDMALDIGRLVEGRASVLVVGGTGSGKTTLLNAASGCIPTDERIVTVEDSRELRLHPDAANVIHLQARRGTEKVEEVTMQRLVKNALRMRPDRIIVGETRSAEVIDYLQACSTGHEGSMSTIHANSPQETMTRINLLIAQSGVALRNEDVMDAIGLAIDLIVFAKRFPDGARRITDIAELHYDEETHTIKAVPVWQWDEEEQKHVKRSEFSRKLLVRFNQYAPVPITKEGLVKIAEAARKADAVRLKKLLEAGQ
jgi:Flp pilus assembly CpaF family ATPase